MRIGSALTSLFFVGFLAAWGLGAFTAIRDVASDGASTDAEAAETVVAAPTPETPRSDGPPVVRVLALRSEAQALANELVLRGVTEPARQVEVRAQTSGLVVSEPLQAGARVEEGQLLCEIEAGDREATLVEMRAALTRAEAEARASARLNRRGYSSDNTVAAEAAALEAARAALSRMELDIARTRIVAPFAGVLETDAAERGALLQMGDPCATVVALDTIVVVGFAPEQSVDQIAPGLEGRAELAAGRAFDVTVSFVARGADAQTRTYRIEARAPNPERGGADGQGAQIRGGMTARLILPLAESRAHRLPAAALTLDDEGRLGVRLVVADAEASTGHVARFAPVTLLRDDVDGVWVAGLEDAVDVIVVGQEFVTDGSVIAVAYRGENG